jgi:hypothetical protein
MDTHNIIPALRRTDILLLQGIYNDLTMQLKLLSGELDDNLLDYNPKRDEKIALRLSIEKTIYNLIHSLISLSETFHDYKEQIKAQELQKINHDFVLNMLTNDGGKRSAFYGDGKMNMVDNNVKINADADLNDIGLSFRCVNVLRYADIFSLNDLLKLCDNLDYLLKIRGLGFNSFMEIYGFLKKNGLPFNIKNHRLLLKVEYTIKNLSEAKAKTPSLNIQPAHVIIPLAQSKSPNQILREEALKMIKNGEIKGRSEKTRTPHKCNLFDNACYNADQCIKSAKNFIYLSDWMKHDSKAYNAAVKLRIIKKCTRHMIDSTYYKLSRSEYAEFLRKNKEQLDKRNMSPKSFCINSALPHTNIGDWKLVDSTAYYMAKKQGWLPECTAHMTKSRKK